MKLRLLLFEDCNRNCEGCCNKDVKPAAYVCSFRGYDCIMLTGGEPMLKPDIIINIVSRIRQVTTAPIYLYTAKVDIPEIYSVLDIVDGMTITLHEQKDVALFQEFFMNSNFTRKSMRLNIFKGVHIDTILPELSLWQIKRDIEWIKNCPLPKDEVFLRL